MPDLLSVSLLTSSSRKEGHPWLRDSFLKSCNESKQRRVIIMISCLQGEWSSWPRGV